MNYDAIDERTDSTLDHLPELFRQARDQSPLLRGLLEASDQILLGLDDRIDGVHHRLSPWTAPSSSSSGAAQISFLAWLASWLDFERQLHWTTRFLRELDLDAQRLEARRRLVVAEAGALSRRKGTRRGLEQVLWGCLGIRVEIIERNWSERMVLGESGIEARLLDHFDPNRMAEVVWHVSRAPSSELLAGVREVIDLEVPAHVVVLLRVVVDPARMSNPPTKESGHG